MLEAEFKLLSSGLGVLSAWLLFQFIILHSEITYYLFSGFQIVFLLKPVSFLLLSPNCLISSFFFVNLYNLNFFSQFASFWKEMDWETFELLHSLL